MDTMSEFTGLPMPVFTAFGWAGEENALKYALSQLELFVAELHKRLPPSTLEALPVHGASVEAQNAYLASNEAFDKEAFIAFNARPMNFEIQLGVVDQETLSKGLASINKDPAAAHAVLTKLEPGWTLRIQQMQVDPESGERTHHTDLFKDSASKLSLEEATEIFNRAAYLNEEGSWVTPIYLSTRVDSERIAAMGPAVLDVTADLIQPLVPVIYTLIGRQPKKAQATKKKSKPAPPPLEVGPTVTSAGEESTGAAAIADSADSFEYIAELMPLHIRRGFVNLTPGHWPFFGQSARSETRNVTVVFEGRQDKKSTVWRLQPDDQARLMLGNQAHEWLEENFSSNDRIVITARKMGDGEIRVTLEPTG